MGFWNDDHVLKFNHYLVESIIAGEKDPSEVALETHESNTNAESVGRLLYNENKLDPALKWEERNQLF